MGTQALTHQMIAREAAKMLVEQNNVVTNINTERSKEFGEEINGYKKGDTVKIMIPPVPVTYSGSVFAASGATSAPLSAPPISESYVNLQLDQQHHVPLTFTAKEKKLDLTDFSKRFLRPAMTSLSSKVNAILLASMYQQTPNVVGTWGTVPSTRTPWRSAASTLDRHLAPEEDRCAHFSTEANDALAEANAALFHTSDELRGEFSKNAVGLFAGLEFYKQLSLPTHTNGLGAGYVVSGVGQIGSSISIDGKAGKGDIMKGSIITFADVFEVHPITGATTGRLRQFLVTDGYVAGGSTLSIYPAIIPTTSEGIGTVDKAPRDRAAITVFGKPLVPAVQNLVFHRDAFATAFAPLPVLASCEGYTASIKNISVRVMTFGDGKNDMEHTRVDVLFGTPAPVRPDHACRVTQ
ncbi:MAG TPA: P22 phage major capsid protein family protein [Xylella fastidiosa subsp. multiplex]